MQWQYEIYWLNVIYGLLSLIIINFIASKLAERKNFRNNKYKK